MKEVVCNDCGQKVKTKVLPGRPGLSYDSHNDRNGEMCKGAGWGVPEHTEPNEFIPTGHGSSEVKTCRFGKILLGGRFKFKGHVWQREHGKFGIRVDRIGLGHTGWPFSVDDIVEPVKK